MTTEPGNEMAADAVDGDRLPACREQVIRALKAALAQGRITEDEYDERTDQASALRSRAELAVLTADLPVGRPDAQARPPTAKDVGIGVSVSIAAASVAAAILLWQPDNRLAFVAFLIAAVTLLVAPIITVGIMVDVWRQKRSGGQLPPWSAPGPGGTPPPQRCCAGGPPPAGPTSPVQRSTRSSRGVQV